MLKDDPVSDYVARMDYTTYTDDTTYIGVQYNEPLPEQAKTEAWDEIYIVDFSYPLETLLALAQDCPKVVVIDHHGTAGKTLQDFQFELEIRRGEGSVTDSRARFELGAAGCWLTWSELHFGANLPDILRYVGDRDLWKWELPNSREVNLYIASLPWDFAVWDRFDLNTAVAAGSAIATYEDQIIESRVKAATLQEVWRLDDKIIFGSAEALRSSIRLYYLGRIPVANCSACISEVGNALCKAYPEAPFSMTYCDRPDGLRSYSLRSIGDFDVSVIAKAFNGGGHRNASGFSLPSPTII